MNRRRAREKYRQSQKGKLMRSIAAERYRANRKKKAHTLNTSKNKPLKIKNQAVLSIKKTKINKSIPTCQFCGRQGFVVKEFPRRPYGKSTQYTGSI
jgi:hypothetical protein